jgi:hypothetical protein
MKKQKKQPQKEQPFWTSTKFKKLEQKWYDKLAKEGFADIEQQNSPDQWLKNWHNANSGVFAKQTPESLTTRQDFYTACSHALLKDSNFASKWEKWVWKHYSDGKSVSEIKRMSRHTQAKISRAVKAIMTRVFGRVVPGYHTRRMRR